MTTEYTKCNDLLLSWRSENPINGAFSTLGSFLSLNNDEVRVFAEAIMCLRQNKDDESFHAAMILVCTFWAKSPEGVTGLIRISNLLNQLPADERLRERIDFLFPPDGTAPNSLYKPEWLEVSEHPIALGNLLRLQLSSDTQDTSYVTLMMTACSFIQTKRERFK